MSARSWTITLNAPCDWLTSNIERNWHQRAEKVRAWRVAAVDACRVAKLPTGITPVRLSALVEYTSRQAPVRDRLNLAPTIKPIVDALGPTRTFRRKGKVHVSPGYGLLPDDSDKHVHDTVWNLARLPETERSAYALGLLGRVTLTITEVTS